MSQSCYEVSEPVDLRRLPTTRCRRLSEGPRATRAGFCVCRVAPQMSDVVDRTELHRAPMTVLRYLDVLLVLLSAPFIVAAGMPLFGYAVGASAWLATRVGAEALHTRAQRSRDVRIRSGLMVGVMMGRVWIVALAVILARYAGSKSDGVTAAVLVLAAFTVYFTLTLLVRGGKPPGLPGRSSPS